MIAPDAAITISPEVIFNRVDEDIVVLNTENDKTYGLDPVASYVWERLTEPGATPDAIVAQMLQRYEVEEARARADLDSLLAHLSEEALIRIG